MSLKFSLRDLLLLTALISVACAALANAGIWWHSIVVTATLASLTGLVIWGALHAGRRRVFAAGWLLFSVAYLILLFGPWTSDHLGTSFITSKGLADLESKAFRNGPSPPVFQSEQFVDLDRNLSSGAIDSFIVNVNSNPYPTWGGSSVWTSVPANIVTTFQSTGHWLIASVLGYVGGHLAAFLWLRRNISHDDPGRNASGIPLAAS